ncbi:sodium:solute symporter family protein [bacterium]|nr:sodium:solute symporter family protein [bacterium]
MILAVVALYIALVLGIGLFSHKLFRKTGEDYFVATRSIGSFVLFMSLFGTHMTAFSILGASGESYHVGIGVFALLASSSALLVPAVFLFVGTKLWALGKKHGYLTQIQYFRERWNSDGLGLLLFVVLNLLLVPYLLIGLMGGGITLTQITKGAIPEWVGGLAVIAVISIYVLYGGMRGTAWVNTFQTIVFMVCSGLAFFVISSNMGGFETAMKRIADANPDLIIFGNNIQPLQLLTYTLIPLSVGMFPHLFNHWLTARRAKAFQQTIIFYPLAIAIVWVPSVLLGIMGTLNFPGLQGAAANSILIRMIELHANKVLAGILAAGVISSVMNSLDSQSLAIGSMFTQDIVRHYGFHDNMSESKQVFYGRLFVLLILLATYVLSLFSGRSIFRLGIWSFTGFAALFPVVIAALYWKRSTKYGAFASVISVIVLWIYFFFQAGESEAYTIGGSGIMPVAVLFVVSALCMILFSLVTKAPEPFVVEKFFPSVSQRPLEVL